MFSKYPIDEDSVERYLKKIRFLEKDSLQKENYSDDKLYGTRIDCWRKLSGYTKSQFDPKTEILYDDTDFEKLEFPKSDQDLRVVSIALLHIMNEIPPEYLNMHNYNVIGRWFERNRSDLNASYSMMYEYKYKKENKEVLIQPEEYIIELKQRLSKKN